MKRFLATLGLVLALAAPMFAAAPSWWSDPATQISNPQADPNNYGPVNLGQLKKTARQARKYLDTALASSGGAGAAIATMVDQFEPRPGQTYTTDQLAAIKSANYATANLGQLKAVSKLFYDRLLAVGYNTKANLIAHGYPASWAYNYPWNPQTPVTQNYVPANIGQLKMAFSFEFAPIAPTNLTAVAGGSETYLSWTAGSGATTYTIKRSASSGGPFTVLQAGLTGTNFVDESADLGQTYFYVVTGSNTTTESTPSTAATVPASAVGSTPGAFSSDESGGANYTIPLVVPVGTAGMAPKIALHYDSGSGNGPVGVGWSLSGLSVITRGPTNLAADGFIDGVDFDSNDQFYLDGDRLIAISGVHGADGTEYRTENNKFVKIISHGQLGGGPLWFEVWTKSGLRMEMGYWENSLINTTTYSRAVAWAVNKIEDTAGNFMWVWYDKEVWSSGGDIRGEYNPSHIWYTGNTAAGVAPYNRVEFQYENRPDVTSGYLAGTLVKTVQRLTGVKTYNSSTLVKEYRLAYQNSGSTSRSRLAALQEFGWDGKAFPATVFNWTSGAPGWSSSATWAPPVDLGGDSATGGRKMIDINGDGLIDIVWNLKLASGGQSKGAYLNTGSGWVNAPAYEPPCYLDSEAGDDQGARLADLNGDGLLDIVHALDNTPDATWFNTGTGWLAAPTQWLSPIRFVQGGYKDYGVRLVDLDGDGRSDIIYSVLNSSGSVSSGAFKNTGNGWAAAPLWTPPVTFGSQTGEGLKEEIIDLNGDDLPDILYSNGSLSGAYLNTGSGWVNTPSYTPPVQLAAAGIVDYGRRLVDVNGDHLPDLLYYRDGTGQNGAYVNTGTGWLAAPQWVPPAAMADVSGKEMGCRFADLNGDGLNDFVHFSTTYGVRHASYLNTGNGWQEAPSWAPPSTIGVDPTNLSAIEIADVNGDGVLDILNRRSGQGSTYMNRASAELISGVTNGIGAMTTVVYRSMADKTVIAATGKPVYTKSSGAVFPAVDVQTPRMVVSSVGTDNGLGNWNWTYYSYGGLRSDQLRSRTLGFQWLESVDGDTGVKAKITYEQDFPFTGMVGLSESRLSDGTLLAFTDNDYVATSTAGVGGKLYYFPYVTNSVVRKYDLSGALLSTETLSGATYDAYGNLTHSVVDSGGGFVKTTDNVYSNNTVNWQLGRLSSAQVTHQAPGKPTIVKASGFGYNPTSGFLNQEAVTGSGASTAYTFDSFGNTTQTTLTGTDFASRSSKTFYDTLGRFATRVENAKGHAATTVMNQVAGLPASVTDANNLTTSYQYDGFGRLIQSTGPDNITSTVSYTWAGASAPAAACYGVTSQTSTLPTATVWYDRLGRVVRKQGSGADGRIIFQDTQYNALGQTAYASNRYFSGATPLWSHVEYDILGRAVKQTDPAAITQWVYNGLSITAIDPLNHSTITTSNNVGQVISVTDALSGVVSYSYDAIGNLLSTTALGSTTSFTYDALGRKTSMTEPNSGTWNYAYNGLGELIWQRDAKQQVVTMAYDTLGRLKSRNDPEGYTTRTYDSAVKGTGKPATVTHTAGCNESFTYDSLGRPSSTSKTYGGRTYTVGQTYDSLSRPYITTYPGGFTTRNWYNSNGALIYVSNGLGTATYWQVDPANIDAEGRILQEQFGNGVTTSSIYDANSGNLTGLQTLKGATVLQNNAYGYNALGNLLSRADGVQNKSESFGYDVLNRLTTTTVYGLAAKTIGYAANGNITSKTGVGTYTYGQNGAGPHAVSAVSGARAATYSYDANGNMTSGAGRTISYVSNNKPSLITSSGTTLSYTYGPDEERLRQYEASAAKHLLTTYVGGLYERVEDYGSAGWPGTPVSVSERNYIRGGSGTVAVCTVITGGTNPGTQLRYLHGDHLGSTELITDQNGAVAERFSYDAFGARRNMDWTDIPQGTLAVASTITPMGFTGHEQLDSVGLIHLGGRVYDPILGRFLSADPVVQAPDNGQSYNRYSYCINNPLSMVDPSGYSWLSKAFKSIGKAFKKAGNAIAKAAKAVGKWVAENYKEIIIVVAVVVTAYFTAGATLSYFGVTAAAASASQAFAVAVVAGAAAGAVQGGLSTALYGGSVGDIFQNALKGAVIGGVSAAATFGIGSYVSPYLRPLAHGLVQGGINEVNGGDFKSGFIGGAIGSLAGFIPSQGGGFFSTGTLLRTAAAAVIGGTAAELGGGKFANGAVSAAFVSLFNDYLHSSEEEYAGDRVARNGYRVAALYSPQAAAEVGPAMGDAAITTAGVVINFIPSTWFERAVAGIGRLFMGAKAAPSFFKGASYTEKVLKQMQAGIGEFHSFPESVTAFESAGTVRAITGGDGVVRQVLEIPGSYGSAGKGVFQFIKNADGTINHRLFVPNP